MATTSFDFDVVEITPNKEKLGTFEACESMKNEGWVGGLFVRIQRIQSWRDGSATRWKRIIEPCGDQDPLYFVLRASYEETDHYTAQYPQKTGVIICCVYGQFLFKYYETLNKAERHNPGSGAPLVYELNMSLFVSENGLLTPEKESPGILSRGVGICIGLPEDNLGYVGCEVLVGPW